MEKPMAQLSAGLDAAHLRARLMAAEPMQRVAALHALECELARNPNPPGSRLAQAVTDFVARGMPFYSIEDEYYLAWVERAVQYWERLQREPMAPKPPALGRERRRVVRLAGAAP
jgi:hypothetical protein